MSRGCYAAPLVPQASTPSWFMGQPFLQENSEEDSQWDQQQPLACVCFWRTLVRSHPLPKPLFFLNSPRPQPFSSQDLAACLVAQTFTPGSQPLAVPPHTFLRQQLLRGQRALASGSLGAPGGTQVDHWGCILVSPSHCEEASPLIAGRGQIPRPVCCLSGPWGTGRPECPGCNNTLAVCPGQRVCLLWRSEL